MQIRTIALTLLIIHAVISSFFMYKLMGTVATHEKALIEVVAYINATIQQAQAISTRPSF